MEMRSTTTISESAAAVDPKVARASPATGSGGPATRARIPTSSSRPTPPSPATTTRSSCRADATAIDWECEMNIVIGKSRQARQPRQGGGLHLRLHPDERRVRPRRPGRRAARLGLAARQEPRHLRAARPLRRAARSSSPNPQKLAVKFTLNDTVMQDSNTDRMTHTVFELVEYASNMMTLYPGDLISTGSPAGVGTARATPVYFKARRSLDLHDRVDRDAAEPGRGGEVNAGAGQSGRRATSRSEGRPPGESGRPHS